MSVVVNQLNRAVSQVALEAVITARRFTYTDLFALPGNHNILDGTYKPFATTTDSGWWGDVLSDANGYLPTAAIMRVTGRLSAYSFHLEGMAGNFPVDFSLVLYLNEEVQLTKTITGNDHEAIDVALDRSYDIDAYELTITRISVGNDVLKVSTASFDFNISNLMKLPERHIHGRVEVTYTNALQGAGNIDSGSNDLVVSTGAHGSSGASISNGRVTPSAKFFKLSDNKLDGTYKVIGSNSDAGWWPKIAPNSKGVYTTPQVLSIAFSPRNIFGFSVYGDATTGNYPVDFAVTFVNSDGEQRTMQVTGNSSPEYRTNDVLRNIVSVSISISKTSLPNVPTVIMEVPIVASIMYEAKDLIDVSLLEELSYEDSVAMLGGISANELTVNFNNENKDFYFNNANSRVAGYLKKNRKVRAWLGVELPDSGGTILWSTLGTFWTYSWDVPVGSLIAKTVAFDMIGLLGTKTYFDHVIYHNKSVGWLIDTILTSAKNQINFLEWRVDNTLYDQIIPIAWFNYGSYVDALNRVASCSAIHIYCDRNGRIVASNRNNAIQAPDDVWHDSTNVIDTSYPTLNTAPPNYIDVHVSRVVIADDDVLNVTDLNDTVHTNDVRMFNFAGPSDTIKEVAIDATATYTYSAYSWGIRIVFTSDGILNSVHVSASKLTVDSPTVVHLQDDTSIEDNSVIPCEISSDFIQTTEHARRIASYMYDKLSSSIYDAEVQYRGDISLTLNNKVEMPDGIAPNNLYVIKRHELHWNGALTGSARLST